jgi:hypothetical protein
MRRCNAASHVDMDEAFCARMRIAIAAGLENADRTLLISRAVWRRPDNNGYGLKVFAFMRLAGLPFTHTGSTTRPVGYGVDADF